MGGRGVIFPGSYRSGLLRCNPPIPAPAAMPAIAGRVQRMVSRYLYADTFLQRLLSK